MSILYELTDKIIKCAIEVHKELGPGLLESVYEKIFCYELQKAGLNVENQKIIPIKYKDIVIEEAFKADLIVENKIIVELKSVKKIEDIHLKQLLTYLKLTGLKIGLLINFNEKLSKKGIKRLVNNL